MANVKPVKLGKNTRMSFAEINEVMEMPNLIEVQKNSYKWFLDTGLKEVFRDIDEITDYTGNLVLSFVDYRMDEKPKYSVTECKERDATYAAPLRVTVRLYNKETGEMTKSTTHLCKLYYVEKTVDLGEFKIKQTYRTEYEDSKNLTAISIYANGERIVYLSSGILKTEKTVALGMAAKANTVIFGRHGSKYNDVTYIYDMLYENIDNIIVNSEKLKFREYALDFYKERCANILFSEETVILAD